MTRLRLSRTTVILTAVVLLTVMVAAGISRISRASTRDAGCERRRRPRGFLFDEKQLFPKLISERNMAWPPLSVVSDLTGPTLLRERAAGSARRTVEGGNSSVALPNFLKT